MKKRPKTARWLIAIAAVMLYVLSTYLGSALLIQPMEEAYPEIPVAQAPLADAIVVLGDFAQASTESRPRFAVVHETDRLRAGGLLLLAGKAPFVLITGGTVSAQGKGSRGQVDAARTLLLEMGVPADKILTEGLSQNTHENASYSRPLLLKHDVHRILLVTSAFHLFRAAATFRKEGFEVFPFPADFRTGWSKTDFIQALVPEARPLYYNQLAIHEIIGIAFYKLRGWA